jgi:SlyX.
MKEDVERLEVKIAYLEKQVAELNEVVVSQMRELDDMNSRFKQMEQKVAELIEEAGDGDRPSRRPPHY